ncbi:PREDICTED: putative zinc finger protein CONSTANS-LIKE 11 isoform X3 [Tarenaya hassleriana]|uniref:putative zinc finger protein CONSTANS-LIKE 11 isoform X3 n=1 Tax=Tarenaya hassleriana TaxID=28532 RepID=UPI00053C6083|nr:PREDICTED: putative zinc finger protein CONSTANS-LIKE 11 isoform X3 [Tarenaya hassleriana]
MYAETGLIFRYMQSYSPELQQFEEPYKSHNLNDPMSDLIQASNIYEYDLDLGGEGDLFKAPEPIMEEPISAVDPLYEALMMISCDEGNIVTSQQGLGLSDLDSFLSEQQLLDKALYECEHELMMESSIKSPLSEVFDIKNITVVAKIDGELTEVLDSEAATDAPIQKSASSGNLNYTDMAQHEALMIQNFPEFPQLDLGAVYGMRRAFSEGDIQTLGTQNMGLVQSPLDRIIVSCISEDRREKLSRYRNKKRRRNFGPKIKYACRKALADNQPRIRGRFAKTLERR